MIVVVERPVERWRPEDDRCKINRTKDLETTFGSDNLTTGCQEVSVTGIDTMHGIFVRGFS